MSRYLFITISLLSSISSYSIELDFYKDTARIYTHEVNISTLVMERSKWKTSQIKDQFEEAALIYAQCGVKLKITNPKTIKDHKEIQFDLEGYDTPKDERPTSSALNIAKRNKTKDAIDIFFIQSFDPSYYSIKATSVPQMRIKQADQLPGKDTIWITRTVEYDRQFSPKDGGDPKGYNVLAHELGHILLNSDHSKNLFNHNLMQKSSYSLNGRLTLNQCKRIKKFPLIKEITSSITCPEIKTSIRSKITFEGIEKDCHSAKSLIDQLELVQDEISDLNPVNGIDFYFGNSSNRIFYKDNNQFDSALKLSYDFYGKSPLKTKQVRALWIHELSHAILNAQLSLDWDWYEKRMLLFKEWNKAVRENNNTAVILILEKIDKIPKNLEYERFIGPYHELFSDLLTAIYFNDPEIISYALSPPKLADRNLLSLDEKNHLFQRSFSNNLPLEHFSNNEVHSTFAPIRKDLWKLVSNKSLNGWSKKQIVRYIYKIFSKEMISLASAKNLNDLSIIDFNKRLLKKIQ